LEFPERMFNIGATKDWTKLREEGGNIRRDKDERSPMTKKLRMKFCNSSWRNVSFSWQCQLRCSSSKPRWQSAKLTLDSRRLMDGNRSSRGAITLSCEHAHPWPRTSGGPRIQAFRDQVCSTQSRTDIIHALLGNMNETPVFFDMVPGRTIEVRGSKTAQVRTTGVEK